MLKVITVLILLTSLLGCKPDTIKDTSSKIKSVKTVVTDQWGEIGRIELDFKSVWDEKSIISMAGMEIKSIGEQLKEYFPNKYYRVRFSVAAPLTDTYGNKYQEEVIEFSFSMDNLNKINYDNILYQQMMNLSGIVGSTEIGDRAAVQWCRDGNAQFASNFCEWF